MKIPIGITLWSGLGFVRGANSYDYKNKTPFLYSSKMLHGFGGAMTYLNPFLSFLIIYKEIYRLEVNIRGMEEEKNSDFYNELF